MSIQISQINLDSDSHKGIIMLLCKRNNFCEGDVYLELYRDFPTEEKNKIIKSKGARYFDTFIKKIIEENFTGLKSCGYFITIEKHGKTMVVGFIIYNVAEMEMTKKSNLLFILIDKKYQNKGFGTKLVDKYIEDIIQINVMRATVKVENNTLSNFYKKFGFDKYLDLFESEKDGYESLDYIPQSMLPMLPMLRKLKYFQDIITQKSAVETQKV